MKFGCRSVASHMVCVAWVLNAVFAALAGSSPAWSQTVEPPSASTPRLISDRDPRQPEDAIAAKAFVALKRHCAHCHDAGARPAGAFGGILDFNLLSRDGSLVQPGRPDASPLYQSMVTQQMPPHADVAGKPDNAQVLVREIGAVRDWIASLPSRPADRSLSPATNPRSECAASATADPVQDQIADMQHRWLLQIGPDAAADTRFVVSESALRCARRSTTAARIPDVAALIEDLAKANPAGTPGAAVQRLSHANIDMLAVRLSAIGVTDEDWTGAVRTAPDISPRPAPSDRVAALSKSAHPAADVSYVLALLGQRWKAVTQAPQLPKWLAPRQAAADTLDPPYRGQRYDAARAAHALRLSSQQLRAVLRGLDAPELAPIARHVLADGLISPTAFGKLRSAIARTPGTAEAQQASLPDIYIWPDQASLTPGGLLSLQIATTTPCYVTLINIDAAGRATVLFPNDFDQQNILRPGDRLAVPHPTAPFQLRLKTTAAETFIAVCMAETSAPPGIAHRFDRQRFTLLGNWQRFLDASIAAERDTRQAAWRKAVKQSRRTQTDAASVEMIPAPQRQWWAAITLQAK